MWYKLAQNVERAYETLKAKGVSDDTINNLQQMTDVPLRGKYIGALMQNPLMPWNELEEKLIPKQEMKLSIQEIRYMSDLDRMLSISYLPEEPKANFYKWVDRVALPSYRPNQHNPENYTYPKFSQTPNPIYGIQREIDHIYDWYCEYMDENPRFNIFSMSLDNALQSSNEWHEELANQTTGNKFTKIKKQNGKIVDPNVVLVFDENLINSLGLSKEYVDWMIVKLTNESDFQLEAGIMGHCLATNRYFDKYEKGGCLIYSLRDESNQPHTTIEIIPPDTVEQIQGKGDRTPKTDYLKLVQYWVRQNNFYSSSKDHEPYLDFITGMNEERALDAINEYLNPFHDEDAEDHLGVPIRPPSITNDDFFKEFTLDYFIDLVGVGADNSHYKTYQEIPDDDKFDELIEFLGNLYIQNDLELLREYASENRPLGTERYVLINKLKTVDIKDNFDSAIDKELDFVKDFRDAKVDEEFGAAKETDFKNKNPEEINQIAQAPYRRRDSRGGGKYKEYDGIYDVYPVHFYNSLYDYILKNLPREFFDLSNKLSLGLDFSPITPSSVIERQKNFDPSSYRRGRQLSLFDTELNVPAEEKEWIYAFNNKRFRLAGRPTRTYYYNFAFKSIIEHIKDIFPLANSVDVFYMAQRVREIAMNDDDVARVLDLAKSGQIFKKNQDKR
jgi:hypothetical protein